MSAFIRLPVLPLASSEEITLLLSILDSHARNTSRFVEEGAALAALPDASEEYKKASLGHQEYHAHRLEVLLGLRDRMRVIKANVDSLLIEVPAEAVVPSEPSDP